MLLVMILFRNLVAVVFALILSVEVQAVLMSEVSTGKAVLPRRVEKIGVFIGTFDPLHKSHEDLIGDILKKGLVDLLIVGANDNMTHKPNASSWNVRNRFLELVYQSHSRVIVANEPARPFPIPANTVKELRSLLGEPLVGAVMGNDIATIPTLEDEIEKNILENGGKVDYWLVNNSRPDLNKSDSIPSVIAGKRVVVFQAEGSLSSSDIRKAVKDRSLEDANLKLSSSVLKEIVRRNLYGLIGSCNKLL